MNADSGLSTSYHSGIHTQLNPILTRLRFHSVAMLAAAGAMVLFGMPAWAECFDTTKHLRGGQWHQWVLQISPGPEAQSKVEQVLQEINAQRIGRDEPPLIYSKGAPLAFGVIDENNARGQNGRPLANETSNQEIFFATFASVLPNQPVVVFLTDPLRSNGDLTAAGVPGRAAEFAVDVDLKRQGKNFAVTTLWIAHSTAGDRIRFSARYLNTDVAAQGSGPSAEGYLKCGTSSVFSVVFRSRPLQTFAFFDAIQTIVVRAFGSQGAAVDLRVELADPVVNAIFSDPANKPLQLIEAHRVVRIEGPR